MMVTMMTMAKLHPDSLGALVKLEDMIMDKMDLKSLLILLFCYMEQSEECFWHSTGIKWRLNWREHTDRWRHEPLQLSTNKKTLCFFCCLFAFFSHSDRSPGRLFHAYSSPSNEGGGEKIVHRKRLLFLCSTSSAPNNLTSQSHRWDLRALHSLHAKTSIEKINNIGIFRGGRIKVRVVFGEWSCAVSGKFASNAKTSTTVWRRAKSESMTIDTATTQHGILAARASLSNNEETEGNDKITWSSMFLHIHLNIAVFFTHFRETSFAANQV